jgi:hypothetical protein
MWDGLTIRHTLGRIANPSYVTKRRDEPMLPDRYCELLTAFVDGELSQRQHKVVQRLLGKSPEARQVLEELEDNARKVKALPAQTLGHDFTQEVLHKVAVLQPVGVRPSLARRGLPAWIGAAVAAAVLLAVTGVSYWFFSPDRQLREDRSPLVAAIIRGTTDRYAEPGIRVQVVDLGQEKTQTRLANELKKQNAVHLELACKDSAQAVDGLNAVLEKSGVKVLIDAIAQARLKAGPTEILVYAENLSPEDLTQILGRLGARERIKDVLDRQFASVHVEALTPEYRDRVARRFGLDSKQLQPPPRGELAKFIVSPKENSKRAGTDSAQPQNHKFALVVTSDDGQNAAVSADFQRFLQARRPQPGTLQIVLVVRPASA